MNRPKRTRDHLMARNNNLSNANFPLVSVKGNHAWLRFTRQGKTYVFNGNDGQDGINMVDEFPSADGSTVTGAIRPLIERPSRILQHPGGLCYLVSCGLSVAYRTMPWNEFLRFAMTCTEQDCYDILENVN